MDSKKVIGKCRKKKGGGRLISHSFTLSYYQIKKLRSIVKQEKLTGMSELVRNIIDDFIYGYGENKK